MDDRFKRADEIFDRALDLAESERGAFVDEACAGDPELRRLVGRLLEETSTRDAFLAAGGGVAGPLWDELAGDAPEPDPVGSLVDRYRIVEEIGRGGMAVVYLAERTDLEQRVALKLIKRGIDTDEVVRRFEQERRILAAARHPGIARLLDGGATADGRPYFVMEHVEGRPIDLYCDERRLDLRQRLGLFLQVCEAVAYAHRNLVVHRDIKPSNILVGAEGRAKLLDFGIARLLEEDGGTEPTRTHERFMTPAYASPEQIRGDPVTTASDVYQLGLLLYRLLTGRTPYRSTDSSPDSLRRAICEEAPSRPSDAIDLTQTLETTGGGPAGRPEALRRELSGDLDTIALMALRKEPERRYESVAQLAGDVQRYLSGHPVVARGDGLLYRLAKLVRRHRAAAAFSAAALVSLIVFAGSMAVQARQLARERDRANAEAAAAKQVREFLISLFQVSDPGEERGATVSAREILDRGALRLDAELDDQPEILARLSGTIGRVYQNLGLYDRAQPLLERSLDTRLALHAGPHRDVVQSLNSLGWLLESRGRYDEAESMYREALAVQRQLEGDETDPGVARTLNNLALVLYRRGEYAQAESMFHEALQLRRASPGGPDRHVADTLSNLGLLHHRLGEFDEAERLHREALQLRRELLGPDHPHVAISLDSLARVHFSRGELDAAEPPMREALALRRRVLGPEHPDTAQSLNNLASLLVVKGDLDAAAPLMQEAVDLDRKLLGAEHPDYAVSLGNLATIARRRGEHERAAGLFAEALRVLENAMPPDHWLIGMAQANYGDSLWSLGRTGEAELLMLLGYDGLANSLGPDHARTRKAAERLVSFYGENGTESDAERFRRLAGPGSP